MRVCAEFGCLQHAERTKHPLYHHTTKTWQENYQVVPLELELPESGVQRVELECPVCGQSVFLSLASLGRIHTLVVGALLIVVATIGFVAFMLYMMGSLEGQDFFLPFYIACGVGGVVFLGTVIFAFVSPTILLGSSDVIGITKDVARESQTEDSYAAMRGHKFFKVRPAEPT